MHPRAYEAHVGQLQAEVHADYLAAGELPAPCAAQGASSSGGERRPGVPDAAGPIPASSTTMTNRSRVGPDRRAHDPEVGGSTPPPATTSHPTRRGRRRILPGILVSSPTLTAAGCPLSAVPLVWLAALVASAALGAADVFGAWSYAGSAR